jgi:NADH-quinone oxidoreductase subunit E
MEKEELDKILNRYARNPSQIIAILHEIQDAERYLPEPDLRYVASQLKIPISQIYHIATFYKAYSLKPKGKHICNVCMGTACHVRGAPLVLEELERKLGIKAGDTTEDKEFSLSTVNCLGACALGPLVTIDGEYFGNMNTAKVEKMLEQVKAKGNGGEKPKEETEEAIAEVSSEKAEEKKHTGEKKAEPAEEKPKTKTPVRKKASAQKKKTSEPKPRAGKKGGKK